MKLCASNPRARMSSNNTSAEVTSLFKKLSLGKLWNSILGIIGGGLGGQILGMLGLGIGGNATDLNGIIGNVIGGGVGGGALMGIIGFAKKLLKK